MGNNTTSTGTLSEKCDSGWISSEREDVIPNPVESHLLIQHAHVSRDIVIVHEQISEWSDPVIDVNHDHVSCQG